MANESSFYGDITFYHKGLEDTPENREKFKKIIEFYPNRIEEHGREIACYGKGICPGQLIRTDSIYLSEQSAIQHEIDVLINKLPTEKDKDNLYILLNKKEELNK